MTRSTRQRDAIREAIEEAGRPLSPTEIEELAKREVPTLGTATVYRTIKLMLEEGLIHQVDIPGDSPRYETAEVAQHHHHHFRCEVCDRVFDISGCAGRLEQMLPEGFKLSDHDVVLYGTCADCAGAKRG